MHREFEDTIEFEEEITVVDLDDEIEEIAREDSVTLVPPPLPFPLVERFAPTTSDDWVMNLSPKARAVLKSAERAKPAWPRVPRIIGAVATPIT